MASAAQRGTCECIFPSFLPSRERLRDTGNCLDQFEVPLVLGLLKGPHPPHPAPASIVYKIVFVRSCRWSCLCPWDQSWLWRLRSQMSSQLRTSFLLGVGVGPSGSPKTLTSPGFSWLPTVALVPEVAPATRRRLSPSHPTRRTMLWPRDKQKVKNHVEHFTSD